MKVTRRFRMSASRKAAGQPSELELQILGVLWDRGPSTVREIMEGLTDDKERSYTAVLSVVQTMQRKKMVAA
jgi:predicted transcriptional regulator